MNNLFAPLWRTVVFTGLALAASIVSSPAPPLIIENNFDTGGSTTDFSGSGSVASWVYWYGTPGGITPMTNDVSLDVNNYPGSGSLMVVSPFGTDANQNVFFGTFANGGIYDFSEELDLSGYIPTEIFFSIRMAPGTPPRTNSSGANLDFGTIGVGIINSGNGYQEFGRPTIPLAASNSWVQLFVPVDYTQANLHNVPGLAFDINSYSTGYPQFFMTNYIDEAGVFIPEREFEEAFLLPPQKAIPGLYCIAAAVGQTPQFNRYQACTEADTGYTFVGRPNVTYSWNITSFPTNTGGNFQQHFFIVNGAPGAYDQAADLNLPDCLFMTVQQSEAGTATFNFRYKTNDPADGSMLFNSFNPTDTVNNPHGWPVEPVASLSTTNGALGTWSVTFANSTNITVHAPDGSSTNFNIAPAVAALFADPASLILGGQPNSASGFGQAVVYSSFSASGCATPFTDNFVADTALNTGLWKDLSSETGGLLLVPATAAYWLPLNLPYPSVGYTLQTKADLNTPGEWTDLPESPVANFSSLPPPLMNPFAIDVFTNGFRALIYSNQLSSASEGYFRLIQYQFTQLQVLLGGETAAPGTLTGKMGTPTPEAGAISQANSGGAQVTVTVNAVDPSFHIVPDITDTISFPSSTADPNDFEPYNTPMLNGTATATWYVTATGSFTITVHDVTTYGIPDVTSSPVTITP
jgi:hypothetical protein